ncbi:hypothetical protein E9993_04695 [Labilibacter sediminis]|nr:hypothetical protein E9993_04695 [Labilibacter sediminis]
MKIDLTKAKDTLIVSKIYLAGNNKTKPKVIHNELLFKLNDQIAKNELYSLVGVSRQNLLNTSLFNFVDFNYWLISPEEIVFEIKVDERWYLWALPIFEQADRNFSAFLDNGDWSRVNYGLYLKRENFRGMNELLKLKIRMGFINQVEVLYKSAENNNKLGWGSSVQYQAHNQVSYSIIDNEAIYAKLNNSFIEQKGFARLFLNYRHNFFHRHMLEFGYNSFNIHDTLAALNSNYLLNGNTSLTYLSVKYNYNHDKRDSKAFPLDGYMFDASITQSGLGIISDDLANLSLELKYFKFGNIHNRFYYGWNIGTLLNTASNNPYIISNGLGYDDFLNGFEYNVIEGNSYAFSKQKITFELIPQKVAHLNFIGLNQFSKIHYALYLKAFYDVGYVHKENPGLSNFMTNEFLYSYGIGLDLVTYYDKVLTFNYAVNKFGKAGFYIHLNLDM